MNEGGRFREVGRETGVGYAPKSGMNASVGDVLNQGRFAIYVSNISEEGILLQGNNLWVPTGAESGLPRYENLATAMGVDLGRLELRRAVRRPQQRRPPRPLPGERLRVRLEGGELLVRLLEDRGRQRARDLGREELAAHGRRAAWPATSRRRSGSTTGRAASWTWRPWSASTTATTAARWPSPTCGNRGVLDVVVANQRGPLLLYRNEVAPGRDWIAFDLEGGCRSDAAREACSNRSAIGAQVTRPWNGQQQVQEVLGRLGLLRPEPAPAALRPGTTGRGGEGGRPLAFGQDRGAGEPAAEPRARAEGARMTTQAVRLASRRPRPRPAEAPGFAASTTATWRRSSSPSSWSWARWPSASWRAGRGRPWPSPRPSRWRWSWAGSSAGSGRTWPAPTSPASASACWSARRSSGPTRSAPPSPSPRSTCSAWTAATSGTPRTSASWPCWSWPPTRWPASPCSGATTCCPWPWSGASGPVIIHRLGRFHITLTYVASFLVFSRAARRGHRPSLAGRGGAHHRPHVPALHLLHDHRPQDHRAPEVGAVPRRLPGGGGGGRPPPARVRPRARTTRSSSWAPPRTSWRSSSRAARAAARHDAARGLNPRPTGGHAMAERHRSPTRSRS